MKRLLVLLIPVCCAFTGKKEKEAKITLYYYCTSWSVDRHDVKGKQTVLYTEVKEYHGEEEAFCKIAGEWSKKVEGMCQNSNGCTSDLNLYETKDAAKNQYNKTINNFNDSRRYVLKKIDF